MSVTDMGNALGYFGGCSLALTDRQMGRFRISAYERGGKQICPTYNHRATSRLYFAFSFPMISRSRR